MSSITYILGYWKIPENPKRSLEYYKPRILNTLEFLKGKPIVFFYSNLETFNELSPLNNDGHNILFIRSPIEQLPTYNISANLVKSCKSQDFSKFTFNPEREKGYVHYHRDLLKSSETTYRKILTVWTSKIYLVNDILTDNPFKTDSFAWVDVSATRFNVRLYLYENFVSGKLNALNTSMQYMGKRMFHGATIMIADQETWKWLLPVYATMLDNVKNSKYGHDEETIMYLIYKENPSRFVKILTVEQEEES